MHHSAKEGCGNIGVDQLVQAKVSDHTLNRFFNKILTSHSFVFCWENHKVSSQARDLSWCSQASTDTFEQAVEKIRNGLTRPCPGWGYSNRWPRAVKSSEPGCDRSNYKMPREMPYCIDLRSEANNLSYEDTVAWGSWQEGAAGGRDNWQVRGQGEEARGEVDRAAVTAKGSIQVWNLLQTQAWSGPALPMYQVPRAPCMQAEESDIDAIGRIDSIMVGAVGSSSTDVEVGIRPRKCFKQIWAQWTADSGVKRTLLSEEDWIFMSKHNEVCWCPTFSHTHSRAAEAQVPAGVTATVPWTWTTHFTSRSSRTVQRTCSSLRRPTGCSGSTGWSWEHMQPLPSATLSWVKYWRV